MSRDAGVAGDLIPLYVDEVLSADSVALVEEHLAECGDC
ncbi:MAG: zf-HC2 domain-containing protein, partial [Clostridia bacterium]|nr:zf-HC2 domain-containing protein [Clostridia bacterium]